jgi:hypothetical protein
MLNAVKGYYENGTVHLVICIRRTFKPMPGGGYPKIYYIGKNFG